MNMTQPAPQIKMGRRRLLALLPAVGILGASVTAAFSTPSSSESPVMKLFRQWQSARADEERICRSTDDWDGQAIEAAAAFTIAIEDRIFAEPMTGMADVGIKLAIATAFGNCGHAELPQIWAEARAIVGEAA